MRFEAAVLKAELEFLHDYRIKLSPEIIAIINEERYRHLLQKLSHLNASSA